MTDPNLDLEPRSVAVVLGTRPEIIKLAHVIRLLGPAARVVHTGQHYDVGLSDSFFDTFGIAEPDVYLGVGGKTRGVQIGNAVSALDDYFADHPPRAIVVQGDTNATLAGALAANSREIPLAHVEAGLRSRDRRMPEEHNRVLTDHLADFCFAPTSVAEANLLGEGIGEERITVTGNTVVEAVTGILPNAERRAELVARYGVEANGFILSTFHRPENVDDPERFALVIKQLAALPLPVLLPLHPRSQARAAEFGLTDQLGRIQVVDPIGYEDFLGLSAESAFLVSDSGGVQEEASIYKRPVVVVRRSTERPEVLGTFARLTEPDGILAVVEDWLSDIEAVHAQLAGLPSPYGDGLASQRSVQTLAERVFGG
ncbi:MAG: non-hydrolyzing UDP-N-acetylglucosamine 2-epimerase [Acidimicrobiia bacterium]